MTMAPCPKKPGFSFHMCILSDVSLTKEGDVASYTHACSGARSGHSDGCGSSWGFHSCIFSNKKFLKGAGIHPKGSVKDLFPYTGGGKIMVPYLYCPRQAHNINPFIILPCFPQS